MIYDLAPLSADQLRSLQSLEQETGRTILAFRGLPARPADLTTGELARIQSAEKDLGLTLVAVEG